MSHKIVVSVRVRPLRDEATGASVVRPEPDGVSIAGRRVHGFNSVVVGPDQSVAHEAIAAPLLGQLMEGYSCTLLAYGQTGSGKTHTVFGPTGCLTEASVAAAAGGVPADWGLFPRLVLEILAAGIGSLHASAIEVYQERAFDLLADRNPLTVGGKSAGLTGGGSGPAIMCGAAAALASSAPSRRSRVAHEGVHPRLLRQVHRRAGEGARGAQGEARRARGRAGSARRRRAAAAAAVAAVAAPPPRPSPRTRALRRSARRSCRSRTRPTSRASRARSRRRGSARATRSTRARRARTASCTCTSPSAAAAASRTSSCSSSTSRARSASSSRASRARRRTRRSRSTARSPRSARSSARSAGARRTCRTATRRSRCCCARRSAAARARPS